MFRSEVAHYQNILKTMNGLRKQKGPCDIRVIVGMQEVRAHRCVLMAASYYFKSVLTRSEGEDKEPVIDVSPATMDVDAVESVINYLYSGEISISNDNLEAIIKVASFFLRTDVKDFCCKFMLDTLDWTTSLKYNHLALDYGFPAVQQQNALIVKSRFHDSILSDNNFRDISPEQLKFLLSTSDIFENCAMVQVLKFVIGWVCAGKSEDHELVGGDILSYLSLKAEHTGTGIKPSDAEILESLTQTELRGSLFEEKLEYIVLLLKSKFKKGTNDVVTNNLQNTKGTEKKETVTQVSPDELGHETDDAMIGDEFSDESDRIDNDDVTAFDKITEPLTSNDSKQSSVDKDSVFIKDEGDNQDTSNVKSSECLKPNTENTKTFRCKICKKSFKKLQRLKVHEKLHSNNYFPCAVCKKTFTMKRYLIKHMIVHSKDKKYACLFCEKQFSRKESLGLHTIVHTGTTPHVCTLCNKLFAQASHLKTHMLKHSEAKLACEICGKRYKHKCDLKRHMNSHNSDTVFICDTCGLKYETCQTLKDHIRLHEGPGNTTDDQKRQLGVDNHEQPGTLTAANEIAQAGEEKQITTKIVLTDNLTVPAATENQSENRRYTCQYCSKTFQKMHYLRIHAKLHTTARPFDCVLCKRTFKTKQCLKRHMISHSEDKPYSCTICEKRFSNKDYLPTHMLIHTGVKRHLCNICHKEFTLSGTLRVHMLKHSSERAHVCTICRKMYKHKSDLKAHTESHSKDTIFKCDTCGLCYETQKAIQDHVRLHEKNTSPTCQIKSEIETSGEVQIKSEIETFKEGNTTTETADQSRILAISVKRENENANLRENIKEEKGYLNTIAQSPTKCSVFKCSSCNKQFNTLQSLKLHMKIHSTSYPYDCVICKKKFKMKLYLKRHMSRHSEAPKACHRCSICQKQFSLKESLTKHMLYHEGIKRHFCTICNKGFIIKGALTTHSKTHNSDRTVPCQICNKLFKDKHGLKNHMLTHTDSAPHICEFCGLQYTSKSSLRSHKILHTQKTDFQCELCNKTFRMKGTLTKHKATHSDIKQFICTICGNQFRSNSNLTRHMLTHSDDKPHTCEYCSRQFRDRSSLVRHTRMHTGEKTHCCNVCGKFFTRAEYLKGHISRFHT